MDRGRTGVAAGRTDGALGVVERGELRVRETPAETASKILGMCADAGFALAGAARLEPSAHASELRKWLAAGAHGEMEWLAESVEERLDPTRLLRGARSVVMVADFYAPRGTPTDREQPGTGRIARYARGRDYHDVIKRRVQHVCDRVREAWPGAATRAFCDTAPVLERELGALCGLGWVGKHTLLIHPVHGSWMNLGGFFTTLELDPPAGRVVEPDHCGTCTRCIDACPTHAIRPYSVNARRCISYLTIEHRGPIEASLGASLGDWLVGCDICQEVCPHNSPRPGGGGGVGPREEYAARRSGFDLLEVLGWDEATRRGRFATSAMKRVTLAQMKRNAIQIASALLRGPDDVVELRQGPTGANTPGFGEALIARLRDVAWDASEPESVRSAARLALAEAGAGGP